MPEDPASSSRRRPQRRTIIALAALLLLGSMLGVWVYHSLNTVGQFCTLSLPMVDTRAEADAKVAQTPKACRGNLRESLYADLERREQWKATADANP